MNDLEGRDSEEGGDSARCHNCGRPLDRGELFCSLDCENEWMKRETDKAEKEGILFCPHCGSSRIRSVIPGLITVWSCPECGYRGALAIKDGEIRKRIREKYDSEPHEEG